MNKPEIWITSRMPLVEGNRKMHLDLTEYDNLDEVNEVIESELGPNDGTWIIEYENIPGRLHKRYELDSRLFEYVEGWFKCREENEEPYMAYCDYFDDYSYLNFIRSYIGTDRPDDYTLGLDELEDDEWIKACPEYLKPYLDSLIEAYGADTDFIVCNDGYYFYDNVED